MFFLLANRAFGAGVRVPRENVDVVRDFARHAGERVEHPVWEKRRQVRVLSVGVLGNVYEGLARAISRP